MRLQSAAPFRVAALVSESSPSAVPPWTKPRRFTRKRGAEAHEAPADVHRDRPNEHTAAQIIYSVVEEHEDPCVPEGCTPAP